MESFKSIFTILAVILLATARFGDAADDDFYDHDQEFNYDLAKSFYKLENLISDATLSAAARAGRIPSTACLRDMDFILKARSQHLTWAENWMNSWGQKPAGIALGNTKWFGDFDLCRSFDNVKVDQTGEQFGPLYCMAELMNQNKNDSALIETLNYKPGRYMFGVCVPDSCSTENLADILNPFAKKYGLKVRTGMSHCNVVSPPLTNYAIMTIAIFSLIALLMLLGLFMDLTLRLNLLSDKPKSKTTDETAMTTDNVKKDKLNIGVFAKILLSFSPLTNLEEVLNITVSRSSPNFTSVHGIRSLSLFYIIIGHAAGMMPRVGDNSVMADREITRFSVQFYKVGFYYAVDSFFFLSGFFAYWSMSRRMSKDGFQFWKSLPFFYWHRFVRLGPAMAGVILIDLGLWAYIGDGPGYFQGVDNYCAENWWAALFYLNNFLNLERKCISWTWYLAADYQCYLLVPFAVYLLLKKPKIGWAFCGLTLVTQITVTVLITVLYHYPISVVEPWQYGQKIQNGTISAKNFHYYNDDLYRKPYARIGPFIIGVIFCHLVARHGDFLRKNVFSRHWLEAGFWFLLFVVILGLTYGTYGYFGGWYMTSTAEDAIYNALARTSWGLALGWIAVACAFNRGSIVGNILGSPVWQIPSKLSYAGFLTNMMVINYYLQSTRRTLHLDDLQLIYNYLGNVFCTLIVSTGVSVAFEVPFMKLDNMFTNPSAKPSNKV